MEFLVEYGLFLLKAITIVVAIAVVIGLVVSAGMKQKPAADKGNIEVTKINERFDDMTKSLNQAIYDKETLKKQDKQEEKQKKQLKKDAKRSAKDGDEEATKRVFLIDFDGDVKASEVDQLREVISAILFVATENDEVVVRLESSGGMVHSYGLAASQLNRITQKKIPLTICVDKVAASGGYMMACVADKIYAAPFAIIGSIGVIAQLPNFNKVLKKHDVEYELLTAGEYKRTLTMFGENTDKGRQKFLEDLELTHQLFKDFVSTQRPVVDIDATATGEIWFGTKAKENALIDDVLTSDDYITQLKSECDIFQVEYVFKKSIQERLGISVQSAIENTLNKLASQLQSSRFFR